MRICIVSSGDFFSDYGGGQVYVRNLVDELRRRPEISTHVISYCKNKVPETVDYNGIDVHVVGNEQSFKDALWSIKPAVVHSNGEKLLSAKLCKELGIPCIVTVHHGGIVCPAGALLNTNDEICNIPADYDHCLKCYLRNTPSGLFWYPLLKRYSQQHYISIGKRLERLPFMPYLSPIGRTGQIVTQKLEDWKELSKAVTHYIAPSIAIAEALNRNGCPKDKISVIPHGIPNSEFRIVNFESTNSQFTIHNSQLISFYYVGRINYIKGIHILLEAFSSINSSNIELHLIGGTGNKSEQKYQNRLKRKYRKDKRILWHGKLPHEKTIELINDYHCLIHPTICLEVFGLDIAEALQQKKYVIATKCGGAEMQIHNDHEGMLVNPNDVNALVVAMEKYLNNPISANNTVCSITKHADELINLYKKTI